MIKAKRDLINALIVIGFAVLLYMQIGQIDGGETRRTGPDFFPKVVVPTLLVLGAALLVQSVIRIVRKDNEPLHLDVKNILKDNLKVILIFAVTLLYIPGLYYFGYLISTPFFLVATYFVIRWSRPDRRIWLTVLGYIVFSVIIYAVFRFGLSVFLPSGLG